MRKGVEHTQQNGCPETVMVAEHEYVLSEDGEIVKVVGESFEYTGMYVLN
jgi:hypothetical protein